MNEEFNCRDFLFKLKNNIPEGHRARLYGILQRQERLNCDLLLADALIVLQSLFNLKEINEQDFDIFIQTFQQMNCHDAVKQLKDYKQSQEASNEDKTTRTDTQAHTSSNESTRKRRSSGARSSSRSPFFINKICSLRITNYDIALLILNGLMFLTYLTIFLMKDKSSDHRQQSAEVLVVKKGEIHGQTKGGLGLFSDADTGDLHFNQTITRIEAMLYNDLAGLPVLGCITFKYTEGGRGHRYGCAGDLGPPIKSETIQLLANERITQIITYEAVRKIKNKDSEDYHAPLIVAINLSTNYNRNFPFGTADGKNKTEKYENYFVGFVYGRSGGYIDCLRFVWYKTCSKDTNIYE